MHIHAAVSTPSLGESSTEMWSGGKTEKVNAHRCTDAPSTHTEETARYNVECMGVVEVYMCTRAREKVQWCKIGISEMEVEDTGILGMFAISKTGGIY